MSNFDANDLDDEQLEAVLKTVLSPVSDTHRSAAMAAFEWRYLDAELANLLADSRSDSELVLRGPTQEAYRLQFETTEGRFAIDVEAADAASFTAVVALEIPVPIDGGHIRFADGSGQLLTFSEATAVIPNIASSATFRIELQRGGKVVVVSEWISL